jgi:hypothetical protein
MQLLAAGNRVVAGLAFDSCYFCGTLSHPFRNRICQTMVAAVPKLKLAINRSTQTTR